MHVADDALFDRLWPAVARAWQLHRHAFVRGCGRETMAGWVHRAGRVYCEAQDVRRVLLRAVQRGWMTMDASPGRCTRFFMRR